MWICSQLGFFSIVQKGQTADGKPTWHIRARQKQDILNLLDNAFQSPPLNTYKPPLIETPDADYRYRLVLDEFQITGVFLLLESSIDYPNFKGRIGQLSDQQDKLPAYGRFWQDMAQIQAVETTDFLHNKRKRR